MNTIIETKKEENFLDKARKIAFWINAAPELRDNNEVICYFTLQTGEKFCMRHENYKKKIEISVKWPRDKKGDLKMPYCAEERPSINVSDNRSVEAIANAITRRFLPLGIPAYQKAAEQVKNSNEYIDNQENLTNKVNALKTTMELDWEVSPEIHEKDITVKFYNIDYDLFEKMVMIYKEYKNKNKN